MIEKGTLKVEVRVVSNHISVIKYNGNNFLRGIPQKKGPNGSGPKKF
jgi:hypothetical protein